MTSLEFRDLHEKQMAGRSHEDCWRRIARSYEAEAASAKDLGARMLARQYAIWATDEMHMAMRAGR
jgi:hypothetical protein